MSTKLAMGKQCAPTTKNPALGALPVGCLSVRELTLKWSPEELATSLMEPQML